MEPQCEHVATEESGATEPIDLERPSSHSRFRKGQSGDAGGERRRAEDMVALVSAALDRPTTMVEDGKRRRVSNRELIASQLVDRSAQADLRATKLLIDLMQKVAVGAPEAESLDEADEKVITTFLARLGMAE
jgi:Family of unknown function (DUF5681)